MCAQIVENYNKYGYNYLCALIISFLDVILLTVQFFYSNFVGFFTPLPINNNNNISEQKNNITEWQLNACFGDGSTNQIDMMSTNDLSIIVRKYLCVI